MPLELRSKMVIPNSFSNSFIARDKLGCATYNSSAALVSEPAFATVMAYLRYTIFIDLSSVHILYTKNLFFSTLAKVGGEF